MIPKLKIKTTSVFYERILLGVALLLGSILRVAPFQISFPFNDGGMFYVIMEEIINTGCCNLPHYVSYNTQTIPFIYPPIGFLIGVGLHLFLHVSLIDVLVYVPLFFSIATIPIFFLFVKEILPRNVSILSTMLFAIYSRSFVWQIMGGGLTRATGMFFALTSLLFVARYIRTRIRNNFYLGILFSSLCLLTHLEWAFFLLTSLGVLLLKYKSWNKRLSIVNVLVLGSLVPLLWYLYQVYSFQSVAAFTSAGSIVFVNVLGSISFFLKVTTLTDEYLFPLVGVIGVVGAFLLRREYPWLFLWLCIPIVLAPRLAQNYIAVPLVIVASITLFDLFSLDQIKLRKNTFLFLLSIPIFYAITVGLTLSQGRYTNGGSWNTLDINNISTFLWISKNTELEAKFLVLPDDSQDGWAIDPLSEWFPALTNRQSVLTPQGLEWLPGGVFLKTINLYKEGQRCFYKSIECYEKFLESADYKYDYVYINRQTNSVIYESIVDNDKYQKVYEKNDRIIYRKAN